MTKVVIEPLSLDSQITRLLKDAERSLTKAVDGDFLQSNDYLRKRFSDEEILEIFRLCLLRPGGGGHWSPVRQVLLLLFQAAFSDSYTSCRARFTKLGNYLIHRLPAGVKPIIYSFGIGNDISFDIAATNRFGVPIYMYDPTSRVEKFMEERQGEKRLIFQKEGIYTRDAELRLYTSRKKLNSIAKEARGSPLQDSGVVHGRERP